MSIVIGDITMSLDRFVDGEESAVLSLHTWALESDDPVDRAVLEETAAASDAVVMGRRTFDVVDAPDGWSDERGYGADQDARPPFFVVTSRPPERVRLADTHDFTFVTQGPAAAVEAARGAAGDGHVMVMGGGSLLDSCLAAGLLDRLHLHLSPELLGDGTPVLESVGRHQLHQRRVRVSATAIHLDYDVVR